MKKFSRKIISVVILFCLVLSMNACTNIKDYDAEFIRSGRFFSSQDNHGNETSNFLIKTNEEIEQFLQAIRDEYDEKTNDYLEYLDEKISLFDKYDDEFFERNNLILVGIEATSGSIRHEIKNISVFGDTITIQIKRKSPDICTADMAYWHLFLTVSKSDFSGNKVQVNIK